VVNTFAPFGIQDLEQREGGPPTYGLVKVAISSTDATPIFSGDLVQKLPTAPASGQFGEYITQGSSGLGAAASAGWSGVFRGCEYLNTAVGRVVWSPWWPGANVGADAIAYVIRNPDMQFIAQVSTTGVIGSSNIGQNISVSANASTGNTNTGQSGISLLSSTISGAGSSVSSIQPFRLKDFYSNFVPPGGFVNGTDNTVGGQIMVVQPVFFVDNVTTGSSA
jgi:hypothetical protein